MGDDVFHDLMGGLVFLLSLLEDRVGPVFCPEDAYLSPPCLLFVSGYNKPRRGWESCSE